VIQDGVLQGTYAKRRLVPFGEAGVTPGSGSAPIPTRAGSLGIAICYESAFAEIAREATGPGAGPLVFLTNDGWFGRSVGPAQHAAYTPLRAVETGRPVARAANTGVSMIVDPLGRVLARLPLDREGWLVAWVPAALPTVYMRGGWLFGPLVLVALGLLLLPLVVEVVRRWWTEDRFRRLIAVLAVPAGLVWAQRPIDVFWPPVGRWVWPVVILLAAWATAGTHQTLAFRPRRVPASVLLGLAVVGALGAVMISAYGRYGFLLEPQPPSGGWLIGGAALLLGALAWEGWLHGALFTAAERWGGSGTALLVSILVPLAVTAGAPVEVLIWAGLTGAVFGAIRLVTGDALGLVLPRAAGVLLLSALTVVR
jgi:hypothetical protein